mmetsp:Transcript_80575/g.240176  ORF Transcript_80575/g.240176 Transcript_80575/m.240176 type:complete len:245 (-) Transcript_80575:1377-2111(-)
MVHTALAQLLQLRGVIVTLSGVVDAPERRPAEEQVAVRANLLFLGVLVALGARLRQVDAAAVERAGGRARQAYAEVLRGNALRPCACRAMEEPGLLDVALKGWQPRCSVAPHHHRRRHGRPEGLRPPKRTPLQGLANLLAPAGVLDPGQLVLDRARADEHHAVRHGLAVPPVARELAHKGVVEEGLQRGGEGSGHGCGTHEAARDADLLQHAVAVGILARHGNDIPVGRQPAEIPVALGHVLHL